MIEILAAGASPSIRNISGMVAATAAAVSSLELTWLVGRVFRRGREREAGNLADSIDQAANETIRSITDSVSVVGEIGEALRSGLSIPPGPPELVLPKRLMRLQQSDGREFHQLKPEQHDDIATILREYALLAEVRSLFARGRAAFVSFLAVAVVTTGVLLYGAFLALYGDIAAGVITALCGAIPATFSLGLYRLLGAANRQADDALKNLRSEVDRKHLIQRTVAAAENVEDPGSREALKILGALRAAMPDASPSDLASLLSAVRQAPEK